MSKDNDEEVQELDAKSMTEMLKLLEKGEQTADTMERKLDVIEAEIDRLLQQMEQEQQQQQTSKDEKVVKTKD